MKKKYLMLVALILGLLLCSCGEEISEMKKDSVDPSVSVDVSSVDPASRALELREIIDQVPGEEKLTTFGEWVPGEDLLDQVKEATATITDQGHDLGYLMIDVETGCGVGFNVDKILCSQSTIKGPYVASMYEAHPESFADHEDRIRMTLKYSDNDSYAFLRQTYLSDCLKGWIETTGVRKEIGKSLYTQYSAREFAKLWTEMFRFFASCENQTLTDYYIGSKFSCVYEELGTEYTVHSKAGWEDGRYGSGPDPLPEYLDKNPYNDEVATNDGALVSTPNGDYILVILSDVCSDTAPLRPLVRALDNLLKNGCYE